MFLLLWLWKVRMHQHPVWSLLLFHLTSLYGRDRVSSVSGAPVLWTLLCAALQAAVGLLSVPQGLARRRSLLALFAGVDSATTAGLEQVSQPEIFQTSERSLWFTK